MKAYLIGLSLVCVSVVLGGQTPREAVIDKVSAPLVSYLRPDDTYVRLLKGHSPPLRIMEATGETFTQYLGRLSELVLVLRVESIQGVPSLRVSTDGAAFDWKYVPTSDDKADQIVSNITTRVERVLKGGSVIKEGERFYFQEDTGTATLKGVQVETRVPWVEPYVVGRRYLVFGTFAPVEERVFKGDPKWMAGLVYGEPSPGGLLTRVFLDMSEGEFETMGLDQAVAHVERELLKP